jgi:hypothetical protein
MQTENDYLWIFHIWQYLNIGDTLQRRSIVVKDSIVLTTAIIPSPLQNGLWYRDDLLTDIQSHETVIYTAFYKKCKAFFC